MSRFQALAEREFRSPEGEVLWLIRTALEAADRRDAQPSPVSNEQRRFQTKQERIDSLRPLFDELREAWLLAGGPSTRVLARTVFEKTHTRISHTTIHGILNGTTVPMWPTLEGVVKVLGGDVEHFRRLWIVQDERGRHER